MSSRCDTRGENEGQSSQTVSVFVKSVRPMKEYDWVSSQRRDSGNLFLCPGIARLVAVSHSLHDASTLRKSSLGTFGLWLYFSGLQYRAWFATIGNLAIDTPLLEVCRIFSDG